MIYFKKQSTGEVFAYETEEEKSKFGTEDMIRMSDDDVREHVIQPNGAAVYPRFFGNEKLDLFTPTEQLAVVSATMTDPVVKLMYDRMLGAGYLTYEDPETEYGLQLLLDKGLITQDRKVAIVAAMQP